MNKFGCAAAQDNQPVADSSFPFPVLSPKTGAEAPTLSPWISVGSRGAQHHLKSCAYSVGFFLFFFFFLQSVAQIQRC